MKQLQKKVLGIIPARGGSKGIRYKNICSVADEPLVTYTIGAALKSKYLDHFITSTDDKRIAKIAKKFGSPVLMRPAEFASDDSPMTQVVLHCLQHFGGEYQYGVILQPTTPLRTTFDIDTAIELLLSHSEADSVVSVYQVQDNHPARMYICHGNRLLPYEKEPDARLRQKLRPVYHRNGAVYVFNRNLIENKGSLIGDNPIAYIMPKERSVNIDDQTDLILADALLRAKKK